MAVIYGIQTLMLKDVLVNTSQPRNIVEFVKNNYDYIIDKTIGCFVKYDAPESMGPKPIEFVFIPLSVLEEIIINDNLRRGLDGAYNNVVTKEKIERISHLVDIADERIEDLVFSYYKDHDKINNSTCVLIVKHINNDSIIDVRIAVPRKIIERMKKDIVYQCCECDNKEVIDGYRDFFPRTMRYKVDNDKVMYYCSECAEKFNVKTFVGDSCANLKND